MNLHTISGAPVSALTFGAMQWGGACDLEEATRVYAACREAGLNHFDTAHVYTGGVSEEITGALARGDRDRVFVATKVGYSGGSGAANLHAQFDQSRKRLALETVDLLYLHRWDATVPLEETFRFLADLQSAGSVRYLGVSNFAAWQVMKAQRVAAAMGTRIDAIQPMYSLVKRQAEVEILPMAMDQEIAAFTYSPLGAGLLTGKYHEGGTGRLSEDPRYAARYGLDWMSGTAAALSEMAKEMGVSPVTLAVSWVMGHEARPSPIISGRTMAQVLPALRAKALTPELHARISDLSPTPPPPTDRIEEQ